MRAELNLLLNRLMLLLKPVSFWLVAMAWLHRLVLPPVDCCPWAAGHAHAAGAPGGLLPLLPLLNTRPLTWPLNTYSGRSFWLQSRHSEPRPWFRHARVTLAS